jgi:hypothetical protein
MKITRRHVLAALAAVPALGGLGAVGVAWRWWDRPPGAGLRCLSTDEHDFVVALAEAWLPAGGEPALSGADAELGVFLDDVLSGMVPATATELKLLLQALDDLPFFTYGASYRTLPLEDRITILGDWLHSDQWLLRNAVQAALVLVGTGYTTHPAVVETLRPWFACGVGR